MKKVIIVLSCIVVLIVGVVAYFLLKDSTEPNVPVIPVISGEKKSGLADRTEVKSVKEKAMISNKIVDIEYPSIRSFVNKNFQEYVNSSIIKVIYAYRDEIDVMIDDETPTTALYKYVTSYDKYANGDYLSLVISNDYQTGGIRSNKWKDIYNVDVQKERIIYLRDIFPANMDYEKEILAEIKKQAEKNNYVIMNGTGLTKLKDDQKFYIQDEKLIIYFDPSEIAPATYGALQFEMPFQFDDGKFVNEK